MKKPIVVMPLATALAALGGATAADASTDNHNQTSSVHTDAASTSTKPKPDLLLRVGEDFLGMTVTHQSDGTVVAGHSSHFSHSSHASHRSHYSSRY